MASISPCNINDTHGGGGLVYSTPCWVSLSRACTLTGFLTTEGISSGLGDLWKTGTVDISRAETSTKVWSQKINALSALTSPPQENTSFSYTANLICHLKVTGRLGRFSAFLCIQRTQSWKVLPEGSPWGLCRAPEVSVANLQMQWSWHTGHLPRTRATSNQSRWWPLICYSQCLSYCLVLLPGSLCSPPWVHLTSCLVLAPWGMQSQWSVFNSVQHCGSLAVRRCSWAPAQYNPTAAAVTQRGRKGQCTFCAWQSCKRTA